MAVFKKEQNHLAVGRIGEDIARKYVVKKGYLMLERNYRQKYGEIDIVARSPDGTLVFIEVKTLDANNVAKISPEDNMTDDKLRKLRKICEGYANANQDLIRGGAGWRIDVLAIEIPGTDFDLTDLEKSCVVRHYENV